MRRRSFLSGSWEGMSPVRAWTQRISCRRMRLPGTVSWQILQVPGITDLTGIISQSQLPSTEGQPPIFGSIASPPTPCANHQQEVDF